ncbi:VOC family protein [Mumia zhuanghuii]|uniref:VOC family protein n=1 Tax=Mumia zhuanghuii TaxID=2585211 RepID=A0A5C4MKX2_9ACTN|nr:VOC family protein [Mumia zhuanghuii]TNC32846.1 VOC family protein [Mumia zhuanghuii]TNC42424.1 VOC family protein [Mumia zhuanghuii]
MAHTQETDPYEEAAAADRPFIAQVVLDCPHPRPLAEFYRELLGYTYRPGDEPPAAGEPERNGDEWLVLRSPGGAGRDGRSLAFQRNADHRPAEWSAEEPLSPGGQRQMLHLDMVVPGTDALVRQRERALALGASLLFDRFDDEEEPLFVFADPAGHPFCIFVG